MIFHYSLIVVLRAFGEDQFVAISKQNRILYLLESLLPYEFFLLSVLVKSSLFTDRNVC